MNSERNSVFISYSGIRGIFPGHEVMNAIILTLFIRIWLLCTLDIVGEGEGGREVLFYLRVVLTGSK